MMIKRVMSVVAVVLVFALAFVGLNRLVEPKYATTAIEGSMIADWYASPQRHDVIFVGDCDVYSTFAPPVMYEAEGITAFVRGTPHQFVWQSYYILRETLRTESPAVVVYSVHAMRYDRRHGEVRDMHSRVPMPNVEAYNRMTADRMRPGRDRRDLIHASMTEGESFLSYVFPILRYNSRITNLTSEDFRYFFSRPSHTFGGFLPNAAVRPLGALPSQRVHATYSFYEENWLYLTRMADLVADAGAEFVLIMPPRAFPFWYDEFDLQIREFADGREGVTYLNLLERADAIGIDFTLHTHNYGLNLNVAGAELASAYFARFLVEGFGVADHRGDGYFDDLLRRFRAEFP